MKAFHSILAVLLLAGLPAFASADVLILMDGKAVTGEFQDGDKDSITFVVEGKAQKYWLSEINSITFTPHPAASTAAPVAAPTYAAGRSEPLPSAASTATQPPRQMGVTVPAGTLITVRMIDAVDSSVNQIGETFRASLDEPLVINGKTIAARGADVTVRLTEVAEAGRIQGRSELTLILLDITIDGYRREITTSQVSEAGASRGRQTATRVGVGAALGAAIGAIAGGGKGAATGAAAGAGAGTAIQVLTRGEKVQIPSESRLEFTLANSLYL
ncbi:MAG: hypothetical protein HY649_01200 [Acidobacteria bacterium]|nr:hypothetical protein [Acidobacteriota bacterium]